jgi:hypothetical protein
MWPIFLSYVYFKMLLHVLVLDFMFSCWFLNVLFQSLLISGPALYLFLTYIFVFQACILYSTFNRWQISVNLYVAGVYYDKLLNNIDFNFTLTIVTLDLQLCLFSSTYYSTDFCSWVMLLVELYPAFWWTLKSCHH